MIPRLFCLCSHQLTIISSFTLSLFCAFTLGTYITSEPKEEFQSPKFQIQKSIWPQLIRSSLPELPLNDYCDCAREISCRPKPSLALSQHPSDSIGRKRYPLIHSTSTRSSTYSCTLPPKQLIGSPILLRPIRCLICRPIFCPIHRTRGLFATLAQLQYPQLLLAVLPKGRVELCAHVLESHRLFPRN